MTRPHKFKVALLHFLATLLLIPLGGCVATAVGAAASATVGVATAVVTAPIKVGGALIDAASDEDEEEDD